jgi:hypothetical protein
MKARKRHTMLSLALLTSLGCAHAANQHLQWQELQGWSDQGSKTTSQLSSQCGFLVEMKLFGSQASNAVSVYLKNTTEKPKFLRPNEARAAFGVTGERLMYGVERVIIRPGEPIVVTLMFPNKFDFKGQDVISLRVPVRDSEDGDESCVLEGQFKRDISQEAADSTWIDHTAFDFGISVGTPLFRAGNIETLGTIHPAFGFDMHGMSTKQGMFFSILFEGFGSPNMNVLPMPAGSTSAASLKYDGGLFSVGYSRRAFLSRHFIVNYDIGPALYLAEYGEANNYQYGTGLALYQKIGVNLHSKRYSWTEFIFGVSAYDALILSGSLAGNSISGNSLGLLVDLRFGW